MKSKEEDSYIKLKRCILEWELFKDGNAVHVLVTLLAQAYPWARDVEGKHLEPGQVIASNADLREATGIKSNKTIIDTLKKLTDTGVIKRDRVGNDSIITLCKFMYHQGYVKNTQPKDQGYVKNTQQDMQKINNQLCKNYTTPIGINIVNSKESIKNKKEPSIYAGGAKIGYEKFGQDGLVELKPSEYRTLIEQNTEDDVKAVIEDLNDKLAIGADDELINSKSHYHVLRYWLRCRKDKQAAQQKSTLKVNLNALKI